MPNINAINMVSFEFLFVFVFRKGMLPGRIFKSFMKFSSFADATNAT